MSLIRSILSFGFQSCPGCGSYGTNVSLLCDFCEDEVFRLLNPRVESFEGWTVRSLFSWNPGESDVLSSLLLGLKGERREKAWRFWAEVFSRSHLGALENEGPVLSTSAPLRGAKASADHAFHWTRAFSEEQGLSFQGSLFHKAESGTQRKKDLPARLGGLRLVKKTEERRVGPGLWVLGDDIMTTGETARAVYRALGRPLRFEVWCLARRRTNGPRADV